MTPPSLFPSLALHAIIVGLDVYVWPHTGFGSCVTINGPGGRTSFICPGEPDDVVRDLVPILSEAMVFDEDLLKTWGQYRWTQRPPSLERSRAIARAIVAFAAEALRVNGLAGLCAAHAPGSGMVSSASVGSVGPLPPMAEA